MTDEAAFGVQGAEPEPPDPMVEGLRAMPPDREVNPGTTAGDALRIMSEEPPAPPGTVHLPRQVYGRAGDGGRPLTMHLYAREDPRDVRPGVVLVHGGAWREGRAEWLLHYANHLAAAGFVTASVRYRLFQEAPWPAALEDVKCAIRWMRAHATDIGLDPERLGGGGGSAGGQLVALAGSIPGRFEGTGGHDGVPSGIRAAFLWYPMTDLAAGLRHPQLKPVLADFLGTDDEQVGAEASPITYVADACPTESLCGDLDPFYQMGIVQAYHEALDRHGVPNELVTVPGVGHSFDYNADRWAWCAERAQSFFERLLGPVRSGVGEPG